MTERIFSRTDDLIGRDRELERLAAHAASRKGLVLLAEPGAGTSELLRHLCDRILAERSNIVPFYFEVGDENIWPDAAPNTLVIIDAADNADVEVVRSLADGFTRAGIPFIIAGRRRALYGALPYASMRIARISGKDTATVIEGTARRLNVTLNDATRDLIAILIGGRPRMIEALLLAAADRNRPLEAFGTVQQLFTDEIFGGRIGREMDAAFALAIRDQQSRQRVIELLASRSEIPVAELDELTLRKLFALEFINIDRGTARVNTEDHVLMTYLRSYANPAQTRGLSVGKMMAANIASSPALMANHYRGAAALDIKETLSRMRGQMIAHAAIDYPTFKETLKGADDAKIAAAFASSDDKVYLPRVAYTVKTVDISPAFKEVTDKRNSAVAIGFDSDDKEIVILAAEIESKLEANAELTASWFDRMDTVARASGFENYRVWLIAPEGFDPQASEFLASRGAYGSSRDQFVRLTRMLRRRSEALKTRKTETHDLTIPMGESGERLAARFVEDLAARHGVEPKPTAQIKTALIEACINAAEHSLSPDQVIKLKFALDPARLTITVVNRGVRLADRPPTADDEDRRGWGLTLMRTLMDDVRIEQTDDGTTLVMSKDLGFRDPAPNE